MPIEHEHEAWARWRIDADKLQAEADEAAVQKQASYWRMLNGQQRADPWCVITPNLNIQEYRRRMTALYLTPSSAKGDRNLARALGM